MARNGSGTYTVLNTFVDGTIVDAGDHNENWTDIGTEITNSVAADGQTSMTGPLKAAVGAVGAPSLTFGADLDTGMYRISANRIGLSVSGAKVLDVDANGLGITGGVWNNGLQVPPLLVASTFSVASALSIVLTTFTGYRGFRFVLTDVTTSAQVSVLMRTSTNGGSSYDAGASDYGYVRHLVDSNAGTLVVVKDDSADSASVGFSDVNANDTLAFETTLYAPASTRYKLFRTVGTSVIAGVVSDYNASGCRFATADVDAVQFFPFSGTMTGSFAVYGLT